MLRLKSDETHCRMANTSTQRERARRVHMSVSHALVTLKRTATAAAVPVLATMINQSVC